MFMGNTLAMGAASQYPTAFQQAAAASFFKGREVTQTLSKTEREEKEKSLISRLFGRQMTDEAENTTHDKSGGFFA